jgi:subtilase family serine protease
MKKPRRYLLYLLPTAFVIGAVVVSTLVGTRLLHPTQKAGAEAGENIENISSLASHLPIHPLWKQAVDMTTNPALPACLKSTAAPLCYSPQQIRQAYGIQPLLDAGITGKGQIITLIEIFPNSTIQRDLHLFDQTFGLADPQLTVLAPFGTPPADPNNPSDLETALDAEWAHVMAPDAAIQVVQAKSASDTDITQAIQFVVEQNVGDVVSMSFGDSEQCMGTKLIKETHAIFQQARAQKQTLLASAGDSGSAAPQCDNKGKVVTLTQGVSYPASDPLVTAVGGTTLLAGKDGTYKSETTWDEADNGHGATGGGFSSVFAKPNFQQDLPGTKRGIADLSFDADPLTGVPIVSGVGKSSKPQILPVGGTSLGSPAVAGMVALFNQLTPGKRLGFLNDAIYRISQNATAYAKSFHDITTGNNPIIFKDAEGNQVFVKGFDATINWDPPTGVGTPNAALLSKVLPLFTQTNDGSKL